MARSVAVAAWLCALALAASAVTATYSTDVAFRAVHYAKLIKCAPSAINANNCGVACDYFNGTFVNVTAWDNVNDTQVLVGYNTADNQVVVSFRGSTTLLNFIEDAEVWKVDYPNCPASMGCKVHAGFYHTYLYAKPRIFAEVAALMQAHPSASIVVTGHSLGASQARLCALDLVAAYPNAAVFDYTFGTPRTGNPAFAQYAESQGFPVHGRHYHVTHAADPVPHLPPMSWDYIHIPRAVWYDPKFPAAQGGFVVCNGTATAEDPHCSNSLPWYDYKVTDHFHYLGVYTGCGTEANEHTHDREFRANLHAVLRDEALTRRLFGGRH
uniref:Fungal lipase-type domain-containing protein n=1 Tax=Neobodo designis TaxID=312471 RepID=A0A7S1PZC0_NEODS|eukprot:CAMPEP_0174851168 /NCGR_PEP_ID=MMETSP1114-20130205/22054_1 /TAXON_ID=312471 /ORGANISM="Neobodo designis, Strain CCAP 1951/1" /LENGTH=325 /DNA_ID=CAMNT_0016085685 /DNA_START=29 /DNA_END=1006 /DNA_ORIENTATION=+